MISNGLRLPRRGPLIIALALAAFVSTNVDDLFLLMLWFLKRTSCFQMNSTFGRAHSLFGCGARVCPEEIDLSCDHVRVQPIFADGGFFSEGAEEAAFISAVDRSSYRSDIHG